MKRRIKIMGYPQRKNVANYSEQRKQISQCFCEIAETRAYWYTAKSLRKKLLPPLDQRDYITLVPPEIALRN